MIDIHCHILPAFDDGAANLTESMAMVRAAVNSGVTGIVATPHFRGEQKSLEQIPILLGRYHRLKQAIEKAGLPLRLYVGAEILCMPQTVDMARARALPTLGNTNYLLTEFFFDEPFEHMDEMLTQIADCGYIPVIAHPERYEAIIQDPRGVDHWFRKGWIIQLNKGSILGAFGYRVQQTADWIISAGLAHIVASDAHSPVRRTTDMTLLRQRLLSQHPAAYVEVLMELNPERLIHGEPMVPAE